MNYDTELVIIIDQSGSMHGLEKDVVGGYNALIKEQKKEGKAQVTTIFFNDKVTFIHEGIDIAEVKPLNGKSYMPSGCTALLDAVGDAISYIKAKHSKLKSKELPQHTVFSIMTDGLENASREYRYDDVKRMIEFQKKCGWNFIFQAANIDVQVEAHRLGIEPDMAASFLPTAEGVRQQMCCSCNMITKARKRSVKTKKGE